MSSHESGPVAAGDIQASIETFESLARGNRAGLSNRDVQRIFTAAFTIYWAKLQTGEIDVPFTSEAEISATQVAYVAMDLLRSQNLEVFELAAWQSWGGKPWSEKFWKG